MKKKSQRGRKNPVWIHLLIMQQALFLLNISSKKTVLQFYIIIRKKLKTKLRKFLQCMKKYQAVKLKENINSKD